MFWYCWIFNVWVLNIFQFPNLRTGRGKIFQRSLAPTDLLPPDYGAAVSEMFFLAGMVLWVIRLFDSPVSSLARRCCASWTISPHNRVRSRRWSVCVYSVIDYIPACTCLSIYKDINYARSNLARVWIRFWVAGTLSMLRCSVMEPSLQHLTLAYLK